MFCVVYFAQSIAARCSTAENVLAYVYSLIYSLCVFNGVSTRLSGLFGDL